VSNVTGGTTVRFDTAQRDRELSDCELRRARFVLAYLGTGFRGVAVNPGVRTVMGVLSAEMERVLRRPVELTVAGRTDAGVHAWGQVISGDLPAETDLDDLARRLNKLCAPDIAVRAVDWVDPDFDARFSATWRQYRYHVWNDPAPNPLMVDTVWHVARVLDLAAMQRATRDLLGEHDFSSFCRRPKVAEQQPEPSMTRILFEAEWSRLDESPLLRFEVRGSAFCHQQVRSMVGTLVDVGLGRLAPDCIPAILELHDRTAAGQVAPPHGLTLWAVGYDGTRWDGGHESF
jgi:tRNA pseudouridine38-40 synthase